MPKDFIVVHCADTYAHMNVGAADIDRWHRDRGWNGIGYAFVIRRSGALELGRDLDKDGDVLEETGAHVAGYNGRSIGICMVGGRGQNDEPIPNFTADQWTTLRSLCATLKAVFPEAELMGHRDFPGVTKQCPNFDVNKWYKTGEIDHG